LAPHEHVPLLQVSPVVPHALQVPPPVPHAALDGLVHTPLAQQPFGHDVASQTQAPCALQVCLAAHGTHMAPFAPHIVADAVMHWPFAQQPAQLTVPQLQAPAVQVCPVAHMPHELPPDPHTLSDCDPCATHVPLESQQPFGHDAGVQTHVPAGPQVCPDAHAPQTAPAAPHAPGDWPAYIRHVPLAWQQPLGHDAGVQAHLPVASQVWPVTHGAQALPWLPQAWSLAGSHRPPVVQQPLHEARSHAHAPAVHACDGAHGAQSAPAMPQAAAVGGVTHRPF
jgi:hypothetical protein